MSAAREFNFDGLVGPTHNYAGLAKGNLASQANRDLVSHPREAALQGLEKMKMLMELGVGQVVLPPQLRPDIGALRRMGFSGSEAEVLGRAAREAPRLLAACASASSMWAANAATVSPSGDTGDGRLHVTASNLVGHLHRSLEAAGTSAVLREILPGELFVHHEPLPGTLEMSDEGAANHTRLCKEEGGPGIEVFTYGLETGTANGGSQFEGRQSRAASEAVARLHGLDPGRTFFVRQSPEAIDAGVFHNDVIAVGHRHVLIYHEKAFVEGERVVAELRAAFARVTGGDLVTVRVPEAVLSLKDAVKSYLFNSQLVTAGDGNMVLVAPLESREMAAMEFIRGAAPVIGEVRYVDVRQSMMNGGGPACLRLRVVLSREQEAALHTGVVLTEELYAGLRAVILHHYREELQPSELADPQLLNEAEHVQWEYKTLMRIRSK